MKRTGSASSATVFDLAVRLSIGDLEKFLQAWIANAEMVSSGLPGTSVRSEKLKYTIEDGCGHARRFGKVARG